MPEYSEICVNMPKSAEIAFVLHLPIAIFCLKEQYAVFLKRQNLNFTIETVSI